MPYYNKKEYPKQIWVSQIPEREVSLLRENLAGIKQTTFVLMKKEEEVEEEFKKMADAYEMEVEKIKELLGDRELEQMKKDMAVQKAVTLIADEAKEA